MDNNLASDIYKLGTMFGWLKAKLNTEGTIWGDVREALRFFSYDCKNISGFELIAKEAQSELYSYAKTYKAGYKRAFYESDCFYLNNLMNNWLGRIGEISKNWTVIIPKTNLDITKLISGAKSFFKEDVWASLSELEQQGLNEAASCLLTNNFTASEFLALRSVESVLRRWYAKKTNKPFDSIKQIEIFKILDEEFPDNIKRPKEISALFHLKNRRNAIAHPEIISTEEDANATFNYIINTCKATLTTLTLQM
jgi:hypothetical protein